jgi:hypothetical protein
MVSDVQDFVGAMPFREVLPTVRLGLLAAFPQDLRRFA